MKLSEHNLTVTHYRNGDPILHAQSDEDWMRAGEMGLGAYCISPTGGHLYNWHAVNDPRGLAPKGFHIPTDEEWRRVKDKKSLTVYDGYRALDGEIHFRGALANFWSSSESCSEYAFARALNCGDSILYRPISSKGLGFSVRCVEVEE